MTGGIGGGGGGGGGGGAEEQLRKEIAMGSNFYNGKIIMLISPVNFGKWCRASWTCLPPDITSLCVWI